MSPRARHGRLPGDRTMHRSAQSKFNRTAGRPEARSRFTNCFSPILTRRQRSRLKPPEPVNGRSRRILLVAAPSSEGLLTEPTAAASAWAAGAAPYAPEQSFIFEQQGPLRPGTVFSRVSGGQKHILF